MNRIYKVIWSKVKHQYVVVSELAHSCTKGASSRIGKNTATVLAALVLTAGIGGMSVQAANWVQGTGFGLVDQDGSSKYDKFHISSDGTMKTSGIYSNYSVNSGNSKVGGSQVVGNGQTVHGGSTTYGDNKVYGEQVVTEGQTVTGGQKVTDGQTVTGGQTVHGGSTIYGDSTIKGNQTVEQNQQVNGDSTIKGNQTVEQNQQVNGDSTIKGNQTIEQNQQVNGDSTIKGNQTVEQNQQVNGDSTIKGNQTVEQNQQVNGDSTIKGNQTVAQNQQVNGHQVVMNGQDVYGEAKFHNGLSAEGNKITNVSDGRIAADSLDAVNGRQLNAAWNQINKNTVGIADLNHRVDNLDSRIDKVGAGAAALAALHPLDFDPDAKWDFAAGYGNYGGENAVAVGTFYRPNEDTMFSVGGTFGNGENMINAGVSLKIGAGSSHVTTSRVAMAKEIKSMRDIVAKQDAQIQKLTAMVNALVGMEAIAPDTTTMFPDVPENHWAYEAVAAMAKSGLVKGYPDGEFKGDRNMTRYEFAQIVYNAIQAGAEVDARLVQEFKPELEYFHIATVAKDKDGNPTIERVRAN
ncbi:ESPR-type extended signal peptide-containing protein [Megasphaera stantonii]|uniref:ESPR-type extended signal peptide-containing protein n=1 Tax=Megasphaera stantonii TaxID=2144175 RepID=UPI001D4842D2|nr:ESPR-type extended signal peptide-containing protein [Megasphaera stantonii]HJE82986.1 S-layer homology domain-containing protein [Megasphaera stantonii]